MIKYNKDKTRNMTKKIVIPIIFLLLLSITTATIFQSDIFEWSSIGHSTTGTYNVTSYSNFLEPDDSLWNVCEDNVFAMDVPPLSVDMNNDGIKELIFYDGTFVKIYDNSCTVKESRNIGANLRGYMTVSDLYGDGSKKLILPLDDNDISVWQLDENDNLNFNTSFTTNSSGGSIGVRCTNITTGTNAVKCYWMNSRGQFCEVGTPFENSSVECTEIDPTLTRLGIHQYINIADYDEDGNFEAIIVGDFDNDKRYGMGVYEIGTGLDTAFSGDGIINNLGTVSDPSGTCINSFDNVPFTTPLFLDVDRVGQQEIVMTYMHSLILDVPCNNFEAQFTFKVLEVDGTERCSNNFISDALGTVWTRQGVVGTDLQSSAFSQLVVATNNEKDYVCQVIRYGGKRFVEEFNNTGVSGRYCFDPFDCSVKSFVNASVLELPDDLNNSDYAHIFSADVNSTLTGLKELDIVDNKYAWDIFGNVILNFTDLITPQKKHLIFDDVNNDSIGDIISAGKLGFMIIELGGVAGFIPLSPLGGNSCPYSDVNPDGWFEQFLTYSDATTNHQWDGSSISPTIAGDGTYLTMNDGEYIERNPSIANISCENQTQSYSFYINPDYDTSQTYSYQVTISGDAGTFLTLRFAYLFDTRTITITDGQTIHVLNDQVQLTDGQWTSIRIDALFNNGFIPAYALYVDGEFIVVDGFGFFEAVSENTFGSFDTISFQSFASNWKLNRINNPNDGQTSLINLTNSVPSINSVDVINENLPNETVTILPIEIFTHSLLNITVHAQDLEGDTLYYAVNCNYPDQSFGSWTTNPKVDCYYTQGNEALQIKVAVTDSAHLSFDNYDVFEIISVFTFANDNFNLTGINGTCFPLSEDFSYNDSITNHGWFGMDISPKNEILEWESIFLGFPRPRIFQNYVCEQEQYDISFDLSIADIENEPNVSKQYEFQFILTNTETFDEIFLIFRERITDIGGDVFVKFGVDEFLVGTYKEETCDNWLLSLNHREKTGSVFRGENLIGQFSFGDIVPDKFDRITVKHQVEGAEVWLDDVRIGTERSTNGCFSPSLTTYDTYDNDIFTNNEFNRETWDESCGDSEFVELCFLRLSAKYLVIDRIIVPLLSPIKTFFLENILTAVIFLIIIILIAGFSLKK